MQILLNSAHFNSKEYDKRKHSRKLIQQTQHIVGPSLIVSVGDIRQTLYWITKWQQTAGCWAIHYILIAEVFDFSHVT